MSRSKRWPWLTEGWEVVEDVKWKELRRFPLGHCDPQWFDLGYITKPAIPEAWLNKKEDNNE